MTIMHIQMNIKDSFLKFLVEGIKIDRIRRSPVFCEYCNHFKIKAAEWHFVEYFSVSRLFYTIVNIDYADILLSILRMKKVNKNRTPVQRLASY